MTKDMSYRASQSVTRYMMLDFHYDPEEQVINVWLDDELCDDVHITATTLHNAKQKIAEITDAFEDNPELDAYEILHPFEAADVMEDDE